MTQLHVSCRTPPPTRTQTPRKSARWLTPPLRLHCREVPAAFWVTRWRGGGHPRSSAPSERPLRPIVPCHSDQACPIKLLRTPPPGQSGTCGGPAEPKQETEPSPSVDPCRWRPESQPAAPRPRRPPAGRLPARVRWRNAHGGEGPCGARLSARPRASAGRWADPQRALRQTGARLPHGGACARRCRPPRRQTGPLPNGRGGGGAGAVGARGAGHASYSSHPVRRLQDASGWRLRPWRAAAAAGAAPPPAATAAPRSPLSRHARRAWPTGGVEVDGERRRGESRGGGAATRLLPHPPSHDCRAPVCHWVPRRSPPRGRPTGGGRERAPRVFPAGASREERRVRGGGWRGGLASGGGAPPPSPPPPTTSV